LSQKEGGGQVESRVVSKIGTKKGGNEIRVEGGGEKNLNIEHSPKPR